MSPNLFTPAQREDAEADLSLRERQAIGGALWKWRYSGDTPCLSVATRPGGQSSWMSAVRMEAVAAGVVVPAAQVSGGDLARLRGDVAFDRLLVESLFQSLSKDGVELVFGAIEPTERTHYEALGFTTLTEFATRSLYIGLGLSRRMGREKSLSPIRRIAQEAARIRTKLVEVSLDDEHARRFAQCQALRNSDYSFAVHKTPDWLRWRYLEDPRAPHRFFVHRPRVGLALHGLMIVRRGESERGRVEAHVADHWTREPTRRSHAVFLGEVALWAMTEQTEVVRSLAVAGSNVEQALLGMGGVRKRLERLLVVKRIGRDGPALESLDPKRVTLRAGDLEVESIVSLPPRRSSSGGIFRGSGR